MKDSSAGHILGVLLIVATVALIVFVGKGAVDLWWADGSAFYKPSNR